jgi:type IV pilus assembly protein PilA
MKTFLNRLRKDEGFTLVELMVVVAIIGLLSAVAIPNFKKYQAKSKTSEAKLQLASIYSAETSWFSDYDGYATCLNLMGYDPSAEASQRYYVTGFNAGHSNANAASTNNGANVNCTGAGTTGSAIGTLATAGENVFAYGTSKKVGNVTAATTWLRSTNTVNTTYDTFIAAAVGVISPTNTTSSLADYWTINENKKISSINIGY